MHSPSLIYLPAIKNAFSRINLGPYAVEESGNYSFKMLMRLYPKPQNYSLIYATWPLQDSIR